MKKTPKRSKRAGPPAARLPLPKKREMRHGDAKKYDRKKEKERLKRELIH